MNISSIEANPILKHTFDFAVQIDEFTSKLYDLKKYDLARQLFRSGTSIGANVFEAQHAESKQDFIHKLKIAAKEASETNCWLLLCKQRNYSETDQLLAKLDEINRLLSSIIAKTKKSNPGLYFWVTLLMFIFSFSQQSTPTTTPL